MNETYIGYANDLDIRYKASSGGVGTAIVKYLFDNKIITRALSFRYDRETMSYYPVFVNSFEQYVIVGSIYHEFDLLTFLRGYFSSNDYSGEKIAIFCLPCQSRSIRAIARSAHFDVVLIGLVCSSQQDSEATHYLLRRLGVDTNSVESLRYRGNGWPSGIQIKTTYGKTLVIPNGGSLWTTIFHSRLFIQRKCFWCQDTLNRYSDFSLADPWIKGYHDIEKYGKTLFSTNTDCARTILNDATIQEYITATPVSADILVKSQLRTIDRKMSYKLNPRLRNAMAYVFGSRYYRIFATCCPLFFKIHCKVVRLLESRMKSKLETI